MEGTYIVSSLRSRLLWQNFLTIKQIRRMASRDINDNQAVVPEETTVYILYFSWVSEIKFSMSCCAIPKF
jgi:hypothetical protein